MLHFRALAADVALEKDRSGCMGGQGCVSGRFVCMCGMVCYRMGVYMSLFLAEQLCRNICGEWI